MDAKNENLIEMIKTFMDPDHAQIYLKDIEAGERILRENPAPRPDDMLLANIKANIALHAIPHKSFTFRKRVFEALAVAASIIIIVTISLISLTSTPEKNLDGYDDYIATIISAPLCKRNDADFKEMDEQLGNLYSKLDSIDESPDVITYEEFEDQLDYINSQFENMELQEEMMENDSGINEVDFLENIRTRLEQI